MSPVSLNPLDVYHLLVTWPLAFICGVFFFTWNRDDSQQEQGHIGGDDVQYLLRIENGCKMLRTERGAVIGGRICKRKKTRRGVRVRPEKSEINGQEGSQELTEEQRMDMDNDECMHVERPGVGEDDVMGFFDTFDQEGSDRAQSTTTTATTAAAADQTEIQVYDPIAKPISPLSLGIDGHPSSERLTFSPHSPTQPSPAQTSPTPAPRVKNTPTEPPAPQSTSAPSLTPRIRIAPSDNPTTRTSSAPVPQVPSASINVPVAETVPTQADPTPASRAQFTRPTDIPAAQASQKQTSTQVRPPRKNPSPPAIIKIEPGSPPHASRTILEQSSLYTERPIFATVPLPITPLSSPPIPSASPRVPPPPGSYVLRRRPPNSHLPNSVDTTDIYDGPFLVLPSVPVQKRFLRILLPKDSMTPPRVAIDEVIVVPRPVRKSVYEKEGRGGKDGIFLIDRIRGARTVRTKCSRGWSREMLVHWEGRGCEDDTWESEESLPTKLVDDFDNKVMQWRTSLEGY